MNYALPTNLPQDVLMGHPKHDIEQQWTSTSTSPTQWRAHRTRTPLVRTPTDHRIRFLAQIWEAMRSVVICCVCVCFIELTNTRCYTTDAGRTRWICLRMCTWLWPFQQHQQQLGNKFVIVGGTAAACCILASASSWSAEQTHTLHKLALCLSNFVCTNRTTMFGIGCVRVCASARTMRIYRLSASRA